MARKNKRSQPRKPQRGPSGASPVSRPASSLSPAPKPVPPAEPLGAVTVPAVPRPAPVPRPASRSVRGRMAAGPLPPQDATIPLERVPYFRADLRRIAITAGLMFVLLIVGSIVLRHLLLA
ncbi:MAG TPA: hypothetical protein VIN39_11745 [Candidatus Dormibacteraeota bacterium]